MISGRDLRMAADAWHAFAFAFAFAVAVAVAFAVAVAVAVAVAFASEATALFCTRCDLKCRGFDAAGS
jgi:hypothetical protein